MKIYDKIGKEVLPREYLPDEYDGPCMGTCSEIVGRCDIVLIHIIIMFKCQFIFTLSDNMHAFIAKNHI